MSASRSRSVCCRSTRRSSTQQIGPLSPTRRVPILRHGGLLIWDSLAICEYACELAGKGWPQERAARAVARSACAEMHSGFGALRSQWPMNARAHGRVTPPDAERSAEIARIEALWAECRTRFGSRGPWLFGDYSVADAMYAPVVLRLRTYGAQLRRVLGRLCRHGAGRCAPAGVDARLRPRSPGRSNIRKSVTEVWRRT